MGIVGFRGICGVGDRTGKWLRYKVFWRLGKIGLGLDSMDLRWDLRGFDGI